MNIFEMQKELVKHDVYHSFQPEMNVIFPTKITPEIDIRLHCYINEERATVSHRFSIEFYENFRGNIFMYEFKHFLDKAFHEFEALEYSIALKKAC